MSPHSLIALLVAATAALPLVHAASPLNVSFPPTPSKDALWNVVEDNFIGVSYELSSFSTLWGETKSLQPNAMQNYMHNLKVRMANPLRIRIGGNGMDGSIYQSNLTIPIEHIDPDAYFNDIPVHFGPLLFDIMNGMSDKVGDMQFMVGLAMRDPDFSNGVEFGKAARDKLGDRLDVLMLGNEPDLYDGHEHRPGYNISDYIPEVGRFINELTDAGALVEGVPQVGGPTICCAWDLDDVLEAGLLDYPFKYFTVQRYPNHNCGGETDSNTNISAYLSHPNVGEYLGLRSGIGHAKEAGIPLILSEYNSVACGGSKISDTFAMSLWAADVGLKAAAMNYSAIYLHTREQGIKYNLFDPPSPETATESGWRTGSPYYGALFLSEVVAPEGSVIEDLNLNNSNSNTNATVSAFGIYDQRGKKRSKLALFNFARNGTQIFALPSGLSDTLEYRLLAAPSVEERTNITWAGQTVGDNGNLEGEQQTITMNCRNGCVLDIPGPGAALVVLGSQVLWTGNSTIAGIGGYLSGVGSSSPWLGLLAAIVAGISFMLA
ncbi:hypothetical protein BDQ12DRAFT_689945 [Crucibulum laeve]|uniref:Beta-glucuronidase C-terminal domain-containing protein n=1 Tax=Crucibulum laeve TaxID=68775 RepID=A0A5C3LNF6_9AGAR|nr:hypothetical protein BDQ12DRAFT_689945 [Crucibulum laeve]